MKGMTLEHKDVQNPAVALGALIDALGPLAMTPLDACARALPIGAITVDSRSIQGGEVFVAVRGASVDGHQFVRDAVDRGAAAIVIESGAPPLGVPFVTVEDSSKALAGSLPRSSS